VLLVDDHDLVRTAVERLLRTLPGIQVVALAGGGAGGRRGGSLAVGARRARPSSDPPWRGGV